MAAQRREQGAIFGLQPGPWMLATQDREFVTQDQDLDLLGVGRPAAEHDQLKDAAQRQVDERPDHRHLAEEGEQATTHRSLRSSQTRWSPAPSTSGTPALFRNYPIQELLVGGVGELCRRVPERASIKAKVLPS